MRHNKLMETEMLRAAQSRESLSERLYELTPEEQETRATWLGRAALVAEEFSDHRLAKDELGYIQKLLPAWHFTPGKIHTRHFGIARRLGPASPGQLEELPHHKTSRSLAAVESGNIVLLASTAFFGKDIRSIFEIERANENLADGHVITPLPKPRKKIEGTNGSAKADPAELHQASGLRLTSKEREVLRVLPLGASGSSKQLDIETGAAVKRITYAIDRHKVSRDEFLSRAIEGGLVDMSLLPTPRPYRLTKEEIQLLRDHPFDDRVVTAKGLGVSSQKEISGIRKVIYDKFGIPDNLRTQTQAFLIAKRDGII